MDFRKHLIFLVGLSMPFNHLALSLGGRSTSFGFLIIFLYFISSLRYLPNLKKLSVCYGRKVWMLLLLFMFLILVNLSYYSPEFHSPIVPVNYFLCYILLIVVLIHNISDHEILKHILAGFAIGGIIMAILCSFGIGVAIDSITKRLTMFGENSNATGTYMVIASIIILEEFIIQDMLQLHNKRFLFLFVLLPILNLIFLTASRTAFLAFTLSSLLIVFSIPSKSHFFKIVMSFFFACMMIVFLKNLLLDDSVLSQRLLTTIDSGNVSGRDTIVKVLLPYVSQSPLWGYGQTGYVQIASQVFGGVVYIDGVATGFSPHNVILEVLLYTGFIGLFLFLIFLVDIFSKAAKLFLRYRLITPMLLCIPISTSILSGQILSAKWAYLIIAYILSLYYNISRKSFYEKNITHN